MSNELILTDWFNCRILANTNDSNDSKWFIFSIFKIHKVNSSFSSHITSISIWTLTKIPDPFKRLGIYLILNNIFENWNSIFWCDESGHTKPERKNRGRQTSTISFFRSPGRLKRPDHIGHALTMLVTLIFKLLIF